MIPATYWSPTKKLMVLGAMAGGKLVEDTATGNPLTFITDKAKPLKSLLIPFIPQQQGTGDPSPDNIRPLLPWDGLTVWQAGKNLLDVSKGGKGSGDWKMTFSEGKVTNSEMGSGSSDYVIFSQNIKAGTYTISFDCTSNISPRFLCTAPFQGGNYNSYYKAYYKDGKQITFTITESASVGVVFSAPNHVGETGSIFDIQLEVGQTASAYEEYHPITDTDIVFTFPCYGGTLDAVSGVLTVDWRIRSMGGTNWDSFNRSTSYAHPFFYGGFNDRVKGRTTDFMTDCFKKDTANVFGSSFGTNAEDLSISFSADINSTNIYIRDDSCSTREEFLQKYVDRYIAYKLAEPQTVTLTPAQLTALIGNNTIWSDADGQMTAVYLKKG